MYHFPIGIIADSFRKPMPEALATAAKLGAKGVQVYATRGEMSPEELTGQKRRDFLAMVKDNGLVISALCGDLGRGFGNPELNPQLIQRSKRILDLAKELETNIVTTHIGVTPADENHPRYKIMQDACGELAAYADSLDAHFAIETGPETSETLKHFLDSLHSTGVAVNLDPANLVMVTGDDPAKAVHNLKDYIVHTHAKDGVKLLNRDPEIIYGLVNGDAGADPAFEEVPLGKGSVPWQAYLQALTDIGYKGFLTIEREVGDDPTSDIALAMDFLQGFVG
ncbi:MAG: sugar phosphate isomerase/epimerase [Clostridiales bacterium]|nr:sugar phosphate isomerase/epimerase [Clostridiales bacterium]